MRLDTLVRVETPEGVTLTLRCAGVVARTHAFLVDLMIRAVALVIASMLLGRFEGFGVGMFLVLSFAVEWLYPVVFELTPRAATPGKRALGLRVVMADGMPVTPSASLLRMDCSTSSGRQPARACATIHSRSSGVIACVAIGGHFGRPAAAGATPCDTRGSAEVAAPGHQPAQQMRMVDQLARDQVAHLAFALPHAIDGEQRRSQ